MAKMEWTAPKTAKHSLIGEVISAPMAFFLFVLGLPLCQSEFLKSSLESLGSLKETSTFLAQSKIECAAGCLIRTDHHECTTFNLDESTNMCTCGRKGFTTLTGNDDSKTVYISSTCQISDTDHILISGGHDNNLGALTTNNYLITLPWASSQAASCTPPGDLANPDKGHIIGHSGQSIVKCGGALDGKNCEKYNPVSGSWDHVAWMAKDRRYFDSVQLDNERLWIGPGPPSGDAVEIYEDGTITGLTRFPDDFGADLTDEAISCKLDDNHVILIARFNSFFIQTVSSGEWKIMKNSTYLHNQGVCAVVSTISAGNELVVASNEKPEIYNFEADGWRTAKAYVPPSSIGHPAFYNSRAVAFERTGFLVVKQSSTEIFEWDHENEKFVLSPLVQNESRDVAAVVGVSSDLLGC